MGHPSDDVLRHMRKETDGFPQELHVPSDHPPCRGCAMGKTPQRAFPPVEERAKTPFDTIHSDLKELPTLSYSKYKYVVVFVDDYPSYAWIKCLRKKADALPALKEFLAMVETQFDSKVRNWRSDQGGELIGNLNLAPTEFRKLLESKGIRILGSAPNAHGQNGRAERFIRTMMEKSEALRHQACIPQSWWEFSIKHAVYLYNRSPVRRLDWQTPYSLLKSKPPRIDKLRVFGCGAYVFIPEEIRGNKQQPRAELMTYLGVAPGGMGNYLFMRSPRNVLFTAAQALFDEYLFPRCPKSDKSRHRPAVLDRRYTPPSEDSTQEDDDDEIDFPSSHSHPNPPEKGPDTQRDGAEQQQPKRQRSPSPPAPPPEEQPAEEPTGPRRSRRVGKIPDRLRDNAMGDRTPGQLASDDMRRKIGNNAPPKRPTRNVEKPAEPVPGPSSQAPPPPKSDKAHVPDADESELAKLCREGGVGLINYLMAQAVEHDGLGPQPDVQRVREWTWRDLKKLPAKELEKWKAAMREELEALRKRGTFEFVDRPKDRRVIKNRWVFDEKPDGRLKARLVAKGFTQIEGVDFDQVFSPVVRFESLRLILALCALKDMHILGVDVRNAYLYAELDEEIYMEQPEGFAKKGEEHLVIRLKRALYGLKQAGREWWQTMSASMEELGFSRLHSDAGIFIYTDKKTGAKCIAVVYVDDALFCSADRALAERLKNQFTAKWECRDLGDAKEFLRMRITKQGQLIAIDQVAYLEKVLQRTGMTNAKPAATPLPAGYYPEPNQGELDPELRQRFQTVIGSLLYIMLGTRPDISFAVTKLAQFSANPSLEHLKKALHVCRYLVGTKDYRLVYDGRNGDGLNAMTDSDWGSDPTTRRSQTGFFLSLATDAISWTSRAQKTVAHSSTEAEYMALSDCSRQCVWVHQLLKELGYYVKPIQISGDNQGSIFIAQNPVTEKRSKHVDIRYHYIREVIERGLVEVNYIPGEDNPADLLTKNLGRVKFEKFRSMYGLYFPKKKPE